MQHKEALSIKNKRELGMLLVDGTKLKERLIPNPLRCLEVTMNLFFIIIKNLISIIMELNIINTTFSNFPVLGD